MEKNESSRAISLKSYKKNLFLTGAPSSGKTTVIKKVIVHFSYPMKGFYTEEERQEGKRTGFILHSLDGKKGYLAHQDIQSNFSIRRYGVSLENIQAIAVPAIEPRGNDLIILDEIGKMECFSPEFILAAEKALNSPNYVLGTITLGGEGFIQQVKQRDDTEIIEVSLENRDLLPKLILERLETIFPQAKSL